jgi:hypothetical protein
LHLKEIAQVVAPGAHAVLLLDQAGWHQSKKLVVPDNITLTWAFRSQALELRHHGLILRRFSGSKV